MSELHKVMIFAKPTRVVSGGCWSCGKSDTYCDGLWMQEDIVCCEECDTEPHCTHTGALVDEPETDL